MTVDPVFPTAKTGAGMYESFYLRVVSPDEPVGAWIRYTVHKRPGQAPSGSLWCTVFDAARGAPFMHKHTSAELSAPAGGWIQIAGSRFGPGEAEGVCGPARWSLRFAETEPELRHLRQRWLYSAPLPRHKFMSPSPLARFDGTIELPGRVLELRDWRGMVGHNWGTGHAERWIWLHGIDFAEDGMAWIDVALGRVLLAGRMTPWIANGALCLDGRRVRLGGLAARKVSVAESSAGCSLTLPGENGLVVQAQANVATGAAAGWRYADPTDAGDQHDVVNCSVAQLTLEMQSRRSSALTLHTAHGGVYELGMRERDHGVPLAPFSDG